MINLPASLPSPNGDPGWKLYAVDFDTSDGTFSTYLYATSQYHAELQVEALRDSARIRGEVKGVVNGR